MITRILFTLFFKKYQYNQLLLIFLIINNNYYEFKILKNKRELVTIYIKTI